MLQAENITKNYGTLEILKGIDLQINKGEFLALVGASGAGKTTLLQILGTLDKPTSGKVIIEKERVDQFTGNQLSKFRNTSIGFVFQFHHLLPEFTALENVIIPGLIAKKKENEVIDYALYIMKILGIDNRIEHKPSSLSGGEQQRVAVARALINDPKIVFADEPTGNLDSKNASALHHLFRDLKTKLNTTIVVATHNFELAKLADRTLKMKDGILE